MDDSDSPIERPTDDRFDRSALVDEVVRTLGSRSVGDASTVYGLVGPWGSGKTSILNLSADRLDEAGWRVAHFNPWLYSDLQALQLGFFAELLTSVEDLLPSERASARRRKQRVTSLGRLMRATSPALGALSATLPVNIGGIAQGVGDAMSGTTSATKEFERTEADLETLTTRVLVIIDDLDRLDGAELTLVMKLVRLIGRLPNIHYLLAYDEETVLDVLTRTDLVGSGERRRANAYLEKIVQRRFDVPPLRASQIDRVVNDELEKLQDLFGAFDTAFSADFSSAYQSHLRQRLSTPRAIARYFAQAAGISGPTAGELDASDYLVLTWLRLNEPGVYSWIVRDRDWFLHTGVRTLFTFQDVPETERRQLVEEGLRSSGVHLGDQAGVRELLALLFPAIRSDLTRNSKRQGLSRTSSGRIRRLADPDYFDRYFTGAVPADDIADAVVAQAIREIADGILTESVQQLREAYIRATEATGRKILASGLSSPRLLAWISEVYAELPDANDILDDPQRSSRSLFTWLIAQLRPEQVSSAIDLAVVLPSGAFLLADTRDDLKRHGQTVAYSVGRSEADVRSVANALDDPLDAALWRFLERVVEPLDAPDGTWRIVSALLDRDAPRVRAWLRLQCEQSGWSAVDVVGANASAKRELGPSNAEWTLSKTSHDVASRLFDPDWLRLHSAAEANACADTDYIDLPASKQTRRAAGADAIRGLLEEAATNTSE